MNGFFRCQFGLVQRSRGGSAVRRAAYQACCRMQAPDGRIFDYTKSRESHGHVQTIVMAPPGSPPWVQDPQMLWSKATLAERRADAQEARKIEISIPRELPGRLYADFGREMAAPFVKSGMIAQIDIHLIPASDGGLNPHIHMVLTLRRIDGDAFSTKKAREWNGLFYRRAKKLRAEIANAQNAFCEKHNIDFHADPRCNLDRNLAPSLPTLPRWNILAAKRTGRKTNWLKELEAEKAARRGLVALEVSLAIVNAEIEQELARERLQAPIPTASPTLPADGQVFTINRNAAPNPDAWEEKHIPKIYWKAIAELLDQPAQHAEPDVCPDEIEEPCPQFGP